MESIKNWNLDFQFFCVSVCVSVVAGKAGVQAGVFKVWTDVS